uniref:SOCS box domain-containing protein n=1 Tax=Arion vulgaris TaxID=1028688 RepID=A0A0B7AAB9_9EUPU
MSNGTRTRFDYTVKIILLGDHNVGKSSFLADLASLRDSSDSDCQCIDYRPNGHVDLDIWKRGKRVLTKIVDTGGQERFRSITASFYRGAQGCLLLFDAEKPDTFEHVHNWYNDLEMYTNKQPLSTILVGINSQSNQRQIPPEQAERLATQLEMQFHELNLGKNSNSVEIVNALLDRLIIHAARLPSLTIDIMPYHIRQHFADMGLDTGIGDSPERSKFKCSC